MGVDQLLSVLTLFLAVSVATERGVAIVKTLFPWLATEQKTDAGDVKPAEKWRAFSVQVIAVVLAWITASFLTTSGFPGGLIGTVQLGTGPGALNMPAFIVGVLASGGSAFWTSMIGYARAAKDGKTADAARSKVELKTALRTQQAAP